MGNSTSRVAGCFVPFGGKCGKEVDVGFLDQLDEGLGHSFCYVRPFIFESPAISPSNSERFTVDSSTFDSDTWSGSFRHDTGEDPSLLYRASIPSKAFPETTFKTISGASVSANVSTARTGNHSAFLTADVLEPAASFESTSSFTSIPLQPLPRSSGPLNGFMSGPLERGFASGPLERGGDFMSGPIQKGIMSGPLEATDKTNFSAPLARGRRKPGFKHLIRSVSGPMKNTLIRTFSKNSFGTTRKQRFFMHPVTQAVWHPKELKPQMEATRNCCEVGQSEVEYGNTRNLQWAHGKAGEDRVHVVLSEEQGWLFIGIYDGFSGPDAPDFLMSHLYRTIDRELEGLLWEYEDQSPNDLVQPETSKSVNIEAGSEHDKEDQPNSYSNAVYHNLEESSDPGVARAQSSNCEIVEEKEEARGTFESDLPGFKNPNISVRPEVPFPMADLKGQGRKSMRLYELLQMEQGDRKNDVSVHQAGNGKEVSEDFQRGLDARETIQEEQLRSYSLNPKADNSSHCNEDPSTSGGDGGIEVVSVDKSVAHGISDSGQRQSTRTSLFSLRLKQMYRKRKSLRKKLFPWNYDWHREENAIDEGISEPTGPIWRCRSGVADHDAILKAMARGLQGAEEAFVEMVEKAIDKNPELCLMGSCVLVMLMKDQDVYVMNLGDSRAILAQERPNDRHSNPNSNFLKDDVRHGNRSRESLVRMELDRISEESPMHNREIEDDKINKDREIAVCRLKMRSVQLSSDHSTSVKEEISRVKAEHPDDNQAIFNDRVKGQLKVTRAFGAEFLKNPAYNDALLKMFRVEYMGTAPYVSSIPYVFHHRLSSSDRFLVLSSDGLYQYFNNDEVVAHVTWFMENVPGGDPAQYLISELLFRAAKKNGMDFHELLDIPQGDRRKYHDDVSVMVVSLEGRIWRSCG